MQAFFKQLPGGAHLPFALAKDSWTQMQFVATPAWKPVHQEDDWPSDEVHVQRRQTDNTIGLRNCDDRTESLRIELPKHMPEEKGGGGGGGKWVYEVGVRQCGEDAGVCCGWGASSFKPCPRPSKERGVGQDSFSYGYSSRKRRVESGPFCCSKKHARKQCQGMGQGSYTLSVLLDLGAAAQALQLQRELAEAPPSLSAGAGAAAAATLQATLQACRANVLQFWLDGERIKGEKGVAFALPFDCELFAANAAAGLYPCVSLAGESSVNVALQQSWFLGCYIQRGVSFFLNHVENTNNTRICFVLHKTRILSFARAVYCIHGPPV